MVEFREAPEGNEEMGSISGSSSEDVSRMLLADSNFRLGPPNLSAPAQDNLPSIKIEGVADSNPAKDKGETGTESCPVSKDYTKFIERTARNIYDPSSLGDIEALKNKYNCQIKNVGDAIKYADEAVKVAGDLYTDVYPPVQAEAEQEARRGEFTGVGITLGRLPEGNPTDKGPVKVMGAVEGAPAQKAGVKEGDIITHVDGASLENVAYDDVVKNIRGEIGKPVTLTVLRQGLPLDITIGREKIEFQNVEDRMMEGNIGYIRLKNFTQNDTVEDVKEALLRQSGADSYIIDMRGNRGGQFRHGYGLAGLFLDQGDLLTTRERMDSDPADPKYETRTYKLTADKLKEEVKDEHTGNVETILNDRPQDIVDKPFIVLVDGNTASSAEIYTGAVKAHREGLVMGTRTFGKGIGQSVWSKMPGGSSLHVTTFRIFTPDGNWTGDGQNQRNGIEPDIVVNNPPGAERGGPQDKQLQQARQYLTFLKASAK